MRKVLLLTVLLILGANAWAGHHKNFKTTAYVMVQGRYGPTTPRI